METFNISKVSIVSMNAISGQRLAFLIKFFAYFYEVCPQTGEVPESPAEVLGSL